MANRIPYFFYAPTWDFPPGGPIRLGNVIASVKTPELPLYTAQLLTEDKLYSTEKRAVEFSYEKLRDGRFSIVTRIMTFLGIGFDVSPSGSKGNVETLAFDRIETTQFSPREDFVKRCVEAGPVRRFLEKSRYRKPVYIITGLKVVTGAKAETIKSASFGGSLGLDIDATLWSGGVVPVSGGPSISGTISQKQGTLWEGSSDFVLAYRVRMVKVSKKGRVGRSEDYKTGAMLDEHDCAAMELSTPLPLEIDISAEDVSVSEEDDSFAMVETMEDEQLIVCAIPKSLDKQ
ncbi:hypothetical protein J7T55_005505 [Diaporthe amygdali]|uniref:uncharacterized protein n=1 Tax=Phomopsis amygdali TaxID=1214568 RepID=UPI0022FE30CC|nr:uncharacterized protein J7T55_005505 [Diaporthe amygdali]KAJ0108958.1 hypothetical protein J7T55_005505 [Diaporthe amygdali]